MSTLLLQLRNLGTGIAVGVVGFAGCATPPTPAPAAPVTVSTEAPGATGASKREEDRKIAENAGILGALSEGGDVSSVLSNDDADDPMQGNMWGDSIGESFGAGGLGLAGTGTGGGGTGQGTIGLGNVGVIGHGAGSGHGYGSGHGRLGRKRPVSARVRAAKANVTGNLPPEVIRRIVRQAIGRFRYCYERELAKDPTLIGRVTTRFVIDAKGSVSTSKVASSTMGNAAVDQCIVRTFQRLTFPAPEGGGIIVVKYPLVFTPPTPPPKPAKPAAPAAAPAPPQP